MFHINKISLLLSSLFLSTFAYADECALDTSSFTNGAYVLIGSSNSGFYWGAYGIHAVIVPRPANSVDINGYTYYIGPNSAFSVYSICRKPNLSFNHYGYDNSKSACPSDKPLGVINIQQKYEVWSDGSIRNRTGWYETSRTCTAIPQQVVETKIGREELSCDSYYGAVAGSYTGNVYKYGDYLSIYDPATMTTNTSFNVKSIDATSCVSNINNLSTEYSAGSCPSGQSGSINYYRYKAINSKSEVTYPYGTNWTILNNTCSSVDVDNNTSIPLEEKSIGLLENMYYTSSQLSKNDDFLNYLTNLSSNDWGASDKHKLTINIDDLSLSKYNVSKVSNAINKFQTIVGANSQVKIELPKTLDKFIGYGKINSNSVSNKSLILKDVTLVGSNVIITYIDFDSVSQTMLPKEEEIKINIFSTNVNTSQIIMN